MPRDDRDLLEVLKFELEFLEHGGYGRSVRTPWKPTSIFQDSVTCLNFNDPARPHPCNDCMLFDFVPEQHRNEKVPCHFIPLDETGNTVSAFDPGYNQPQMEEAVKEWLRRAIQRIENQRSQRVAS
jgi:hypothetical protein